MDPCGPDAGQERGCARPISILAESAGAAYSLEALRSTSGRPAGLAPEPAPKRSTPRDEVAPPRASAALGSLATTPSPCAPRSLGSLTIGASRPVAFLSEFASRRQSSPVDALRRLSPPAAAEFANPAPPRAMPPPRVRAFAAPPAPRITYTMRQPRPVARPENGVTGSAAPTPALAPEAVLNAVSAQLSSAARAVSAATPVLTRQWRHFPRRGDDPGVRKLLPPPGVDGQPTRSLTPIPSTHRRDGAAVRHGEQTNGCERRAIALCGSAPPPEYFLHRASWRLVEDSLVTVTGHSGIERT